MLFYHITIEHVVEETMLHSLEKIQTNKILRSVCSHSRQPYGM